MNKIYKNDKILDYDIKINLDLKNFDNLIYDKNFEIKNLFIYNDKKRNNIFIKCETNNKDEIIKLKIYLENELEKLKKDGIKAVSKDIISNKYKITTNDNKIISEITKNSTYYKKLQFFIKNGGKVEEKTDKEEIIKKLKKETTKRIATIDKKEYDNVSWLYKSQNLQDIKQSYTIQQLSETQIPKEDKIPKEDYDQACKILKRKDMHIKDYKLLKNKILKMNKKDLINFKVSDDENWTETKKENQKSILQKALSFVGIGK